MDLLINSHQLDHIFFNSIACQKYPSLSLVQHTEDVSLWAKFNLAAFEIS